MTMQHHPTDSVSESGSVLKGKHIIIGITGGIAAYKSATLVRLFVKAGAEVQVVMTPNAREFITPVTLSTLSGRPVITEFFTANTGQWNSHVSLGLWADAMIIAPATACTIAKMASGVADNMLVTTYLSAKEQVFVAPAMDLDMMAHPSTTRNLELLRSYGNIIIEPAEGELASHLCGRGRMEEPENIFKVVADYFMTNQRSCGHCSLKGKKVLITAGPTYERIDPVRFIGNFSSGKMGYALADEAARRGADVVVVSGPVSIKPSCRQVRVIDVESARGMLHACQQEFADADITVMAAAVADYAPLKAATCKIKRETDDIPNITLVKNPDIAATLGKEKQPGQQILVGFALETDNAVEHGRDKIKRKNLDAIVVNSLADEGAGFGCDTNKVTMLDDNGSVILETPVMSKKELAGRILDAICDLRHIATPDVK